MTWPDAFALVGLFGLIGWVLYLHKQFMETRREYETNLARWQRDTASAAAKIVADMTRVPGPLTKVFDEMKKAGMLG